MRVADRMSNLGTESAFVVLAKAKALEAQGKDMVHLEIGEPDFPTPRHIIEAAYQALLAGQTHYTASPGIPELRRAIAEEASAVRGIDVNPDHVVVMPGAKPVIFFGMMAVANPGDEVIYPNPGFPVYESMITFVGARPVPIPLREERQFSFDIDELKSKITDRTKMIILNYPHNPTGGSLSKEDLQEVAAICMERDILVMADEVYRRIIYDGEFFSIASIPDMLKNTIILDGFSKTYAMTGWRLGYGIFPEELVEPITRLMTNSVSCTAAYAQHACIAALKGPQDEPMAMVQEFRRRRDFVVDGINQIPGMRCLLPAGAFYVFPNIEETGLTGDEFGDKMLDFGVASLAGTAFGEYGAGHVRFSYANSIENLGKALERIEYGLSKLKAAPRSRS
ncbi:MAG: pyridoxal phosphate-dependent aminotransferase [Bacteroidetes bacterium]|nr:pyridoxal phosphate-dependent aminotransferase [Bacteroidota bacterium]MCL5026046.1 pyridoxal phosphate-dependent aminotransferase [Chloroflexota bacterium]